jgi:hypothetical protein
MELVSCECICMFRENVLSFVLSIRGVHGKIDKCRDGDGTFISHSFELKYKAYRAG